MVSLLLIELSEFASQVIVLLMHCYIHMTVNHI